MDLLSLRLFLRVAELGGVSAAARDVGLSPASASARLGKLETTLGFRLFNRTTRAISLTTDGAAFLPYAQEALAALEAGTAAIRGEGHAVQGTLRMTMPGSFGRMHVIPLLSAFRERYPNITLDLRLSDEVLDVVEGAYDLIIRNAPLEDSTMIARRLAPDRRLLVASPKYLARRGAPATVADLAEHDTVLFPDRKPWKFENGESFTPTRPLILNDGEAMRHVLEQGFGIGIKAEWNAYQSLAAGRLVPVLPDNPLVSDASIWALQPGGRMVIPKVRAMIDFLLERFSPVPPWAIDTVDEDS